ncbi:MAG: AGE family epimerase/isomerase [Verrucomicrobiota bacterium]
MQRNRTIWIAGCALWLGIAGQAATLQDYAKEYRKQLAEKIMPYWYDTMDREHGGYLLADALSGRQVATDKSLVTQSRMVWGFAHADIKGFSDKQHNYLKAAEHGYRFLLEHFRDPENGGYYWKLGTDGKILDDRKILYGQCFVIYAMVEYSRASGRQEPIDRAMELYRSIQQRSHDANNDGWFEHFKRDWTPLMQHDETIVVELGGHKSANTHLHLMECLTELYDVTHHSEVKKSLEECLRLNQDYFYPLEAGKSCFHRQPDWRLVTRPASAGLSYGHNVEFAWLMIRAELVLGRKPSWSHFNAHLEHALKYGYDWINGGIYARGIDNQPATATEKVWWAEAELIAALTDGLKRKWNPMYEAALEKQIRFIAEKQTAPDGIWLDTVTSEGNPKSPGKAHAWKANYHDVRAMVKFMEAFEKD